MVKFVIKKLEGSTARAVGADATSFTMRRVAGADGVKTITTIDTGSDTFGNDLTYAFGRNVAKARRENKRVTGMTDRVPAKA